MRLRVSFDHGECTARHAGKEATREFSRSGGTMAVRMPRQNRVRIYKLSAKAAVFEVDMSAFEGSKLSGSSRYIFYRDVRPHKLHTAH